MRELFFKYRYAGVLVILIYILNGCSSRRSVQVTNMEIELQRLQAVRFDPSYYYDVEVEVDALCEDLVSQWAASGINAVYVKIHDPLYGAVYRTKYEYNIQTDYGDQDLFGVLLRECHDTGIQVFAWIPAFLHKQAWEANPEWRVKQKDGSDYRPDQNAYHLCVRRSEVRQWWKGFIEEILDRYPQIDGLDIAEPVVAWNLKDGCYCDACQESISVPITHWDSDSVAIRRSLPMTTLLFETAELIQSAQMIVSVTTVVTPHADGQLRSSSQQRMVTGFDLDGVLNGLEQSDIMNIELIWQQWAHRFQDEETFSADWTGPAVRQALQQVDGRTRFVAHVELTPFGEFHVDEDTFIEIVQHAWREGAWGIDFYDTNLADEAQLWSSVREAMTFIPVKNTLVVYDPEGENDARQIAVLLRHFHSSVQLVPLRERFIPDAYVSSDIVFYVGASFRPSLPSSFLRWIESTDRTVCWINYNVNLMSEAWWKDQGWRIVDVEEDKAYRIVYKGEEFVKLDSSMLVIQVDDPDICHVYASGRSERGEVPYVVRTDRFWYVADLPTSFVTEGGRHIVLSDLLHDILQEDHQEKHFSLVRIEDVNPQSDPEGLNAIADYLGSKKIPFSVGITPFYLDPSTNVAVELSDRPELVKTLRHVVRKGGSLVLHGCTHQYRGQSTIDYEFWDGLQDQPLFEDSREYVQERIIRALNECSENGLFPLAWETPHYAASLLDYSIINDYFSTAYERRQTSDILGTDQLLPFLIPDWDGKGRLIPENLGYVPMSDPSPVNIVEYARKNLVNRDGFASFFFHPFVPIEVLKTLVDEIQKLGYQFGDIRDFTHHIESPSHQIMTGEGHMEVALNDQYFEEFFLDAKGKKKEHQTTDDRSDGTVSKSIMCPPKWIYVARASDAKHPGVMSGLWSFTSRLPVKIDRLWEAPPFTYTRDPLIPLILIDPEVEGSLAIDQNSFLNAFESLGIDWTVLSVSEFLDIQGNINLLVLPQAAAQKINEQQALFIVNALSRGLNLILEGESDVSRRIGLIHGDEVKEIDHVRDEYYPQVDIHWKEKDTYRIPEVDIDYVTYYSENVTDDPIVIGGEYGEGKYLYFATLFDPTTGLGYGRYPYYCDLLQRQFDLWPIIKRNKAEMYFEPGDREDVSIEDLVKLWKESGFRTVYVAGWHVYADWTYDYERLIQLAHENAMTVYLWLELPHVGQLFWDAHPEWREITATGREAIVDWRRNMALTDSSCREAVFEGLRSLIHRYDWDGINLAELYFESPLGPEHPEVFTPMHPTVRNDFENEHGFDPILLFDESSDSYWKRNQTRWAIFANYRRELIVNLHAQFLEFLQIQKEQKDKDLEIIVTALDDIIAKVTGRNVAMDTRALIDLKKTIPFTLQIEDPQELWHLGPSRYDTLSMTYKRLIPNQQLILDINVVPYRSFEESLAPTRQPTGLELSNFIGSALQQNNRVALYSESSIYLVDLPWIAYGLGRNTDEEITDNVIKVETGYTVEMELDPEAHADIRVNGELWPAYYQGNILLPRGSHTIQTMTGTEILKNKFRPSIRLLDISDELISCRIIPEGLELICVSMRPNYIVLNERPKTVYLNNQVYEQPLNQGFMGYSLRLPSGYHTVRIISRSAGSFSLNNISLVVSIFIVLVSVLFGSLLIVLYVRGIRRRRRARRI